MHLNDRTACIDQQLLRIVERLVNCLQLQGDNLLSARLCITMPVDTQRVASCDRLLDLIGQIDRDMGQVEGLGRVCKVHFLIGCPIATAGIEVDHELQIGADLRRVQPGLLASKDGKRLAADEHQGERAARILGVSCNGWRGFYEERSRRSWMEEESLLVDRVKVILKLERENGIGVRFSDLDRRVDLLLGPENSDLFSSELNLASRRDDSQLVFL